MIAADRSFIFRKYFMRSWVGSLLKKQSLFPRDYDFSSIRKYSSIVDLTAAFVPKYTEFKTPDEYYAGMLSPTES
jgi:hypothetical protein